MKPFASDRRRTATRSIPAGRARPSDWALVACATAACSLRPSGTDPSRGVRQDGSGRSVDSAPRSAAPRLSRRTASVGDGEAFFDQDFPCIASLDEDVGQRPTVSVPASAPQSDGPGRGYLDEPTRGLPSDLTLLAALRGAASLRRVRSQDADLLAAELESVAVDHAVAVQAPTLAAAQWRALLEKPGLSDRDEMRHPTKVRPVRWPGQGDERRQGQGKRLRHAFGLSAAAGQHFIRHRTGRGGSAQAGALRYVRFLGSGERVVPPSAAERGERCEPCGVRSIKVGRWRSSSRWVRPSPAPSDPGHPRPRLVLWCDTAPRSGGSPCERFLDVPSSRRSAKNSPPGLASPPPAAPVDRRLSHRCFARTSPGAQ